MPQEFLDGCYKFAIEVFCECMTRVIGQNAQQHDRIVLDMVRGLVRGGEIFANAHGGLFGGCGTRFGAFDDNWQVNELISLLLRGKCRVSDGIKIKDHAGDGEPPACQHTGLCGLLLTSQKVV